MIELLILRNYSEFYNVTFLGPLSNPNDVCYPNCSQRGPEAKQSQQVLGGNDQNKSDKQENNVENYKQESNAQNYKQESNVENNKRRNLAQNETINSRTDKAKAEYQVATLLNEQAVDKNMLGKSAKAKEYTVAKELAKILGKLFGEEFTWPQSNSQSTEDEKRFFDSLNNTFEGKLQSPVHDYNLRIVEKEDHCKKTSRTLPRNVCCELHERQWARYNALDEKVLTPFKQKANFLPFFTTFSETIKYDTFWDDITTDDYLEEDKLKVLANAGCHFKKIREIFKENASDFTGNSVASFGLSAILALAVFGL